MKAVLTSFTHGLSANISVTFQATQNLYAHAINHYLVFCDKFYVVLGHFGKDIFLPKG